MPVVSSSKHLAEAWRGFMQEIASCMPFFSHLHCASWSIGAIAPQTSPPPNGPEVTSVTSVTSRPFFSFSMSALATRSSAQRF